jgi:hypothetical protein
MSYAVGLQIVFLKLYLAHWVSIESLEFIGPSLHKFFGYFALKSSSSH